MKHMKMGRRGLLVALAALCAMPLMTAKTSFADNATLDFTLSNQTGFGVTSVYIAPHDATEYGDDLMKEDILATDDKMDIVFDPQDDNKDWDLAISDKDSHIFTFGPLDLSTIQVITLYYKDGVCKAVANGDEYVGTKVD